MSVRALLDNYRSGRPLVLMVDDKYALFPYDLASKGVTYTVLGFYSIVYAWGISFPHLGLTYVDDRFSRV